MTRTLLGPTSQQGVGEAVQRRCNIVFTNSAAGTTHYRGSVVGGVIELPLGDDNVIENVGADSHRSALGNVPQGSCPCRAVY